YDLDWWTRLTLLEDYVADMNIIRVQEYRLQRSLALLASASDDNFNEIYEATEGRRRELTELIMPWLSMGPKSLAEAIPAMREKYVEMFGDPATPEFQTSMQELLDYWKNKGWQTP
ncbi:unnamed protein product, partial [marine sediment metagenome]